MDEAFDRADSDFTRMAMDVFVSFGFHMILATPLKAFGTLEDYVDGIGFVTCDDFRSSQVKAVQFADLPAAEGLLEDTAEANGSLSPPGLDHLAGQTTQTLAVRMSDALIDDLALSGDRAARRFIPPQCARLGG